MKSIIWENRVLKILDQTQLPLKEEYFICKNENDVIDAIKKLMVRGAPAIGVAAAFGLVLAGISINTSNKEVLINKLFIAGENLKSARPTAVNLFWAVDRMHERINSNMKASCVSCEQIIDQLEEEAIKIFKEDINQNIKIGEFGLEIFKNKLNVLTHCNAGALATAGYGTALGVIRTAYKNSKINKVFATETRPLLQGSRLTAWELNKDSIPVTVITDSMAGYLMGKGMIDLIIVGADRIALNGDTANKIGTYSLAIIAAYHKIPFYIAAPKSTIDFSITDGKEIIIEERDGSEIRNINNVNIFSDEITVCNPAFDVTPATLITGIITDKGNLFPPFKSSIKNIINLK